MLLNVADSDIEVPLRRRPSIAVNPGRFSVCEATSSVNVRVLASLMSKVSYLFIYLVVFNNLYLNIYI